MLVVQTQEQVPANTKSAGVTRFGLAFSSLVGSRNHKRLPVSHARSPTTVISIIYKVNSSCPYTRWTPVK